MTDNELEQLRQDVQYLKDRQAIYDCIALHARGHDRHDVDLLTSVYHEDGVDEHGFAINTVNRPGFTGGLFVRISGDHIECI